MSKLLEICKGCGKWTSTTSGVGVIKRIYTMVIDACAGCDAGESTVNIAELVAAQQGEQHEA